MMKRILSSVLAIALLAPTAALSHAIPKHPHTYPQPVSPIPIVINRTALSDANIELSAVWADPQYVQLAYTGRTIYVGTRMCLNFRNTATQAATAVRFAFVPADAFGEGTAILSGDRVGSFAPGVEIAGPPVNDYSANSESLLNCFKVYAPGANHFIVAVSKVAYADGYIWSWDPPANHPPFDLEPERDLSTPDTHVLMMAPGIPMSPTDLPTIPPDVSVQP